MTHLPLDTLIQVQDTTERWHLASVGGGIFCVIARRDVGVGTVQWTYGTDLVNCGHCSLVLRQLAAAA